MDTPEDRIFEFGDFVLNPRERSLLRGVKPVPLTPKAFDLLFFLVRHGGRLTTKNELLQEVRPGYVCRRGQPDGQHLGVAQGLGAGLRPQRNDRDGREAGLPFRRTGYYASEGEHDRPQRTHYLGCHIAVRRRRTGDRISGRWVHRGDDEQHCASA